MRTALLASALSGKAISINNICTDQKNKSGLSEPLIAFTEAMVSCTDAEIKGLGKGSDTITFSPQKSFTPPRKFKIDLGGPHSIALALIPFAIAGIHSPKRITIEATGMTHGLDAPSVDVLKEYLLRPLMPYADECMLSINKVAFYPDHDGNVTLSVRGKHELDKNSPRFSFKPSSDLVAIRGKLVASKDLAEQNILDRIEQLLRLAYREKQVPLVIDTNYVSSSENACAISLNALFGDQDGYDNDKPWIRQLDRHYRKKDLVDGFDNRVYEFIREFEASMLSQEIEPLLAEQILPLVALQGGEVKMERITERLKGYAYVLETVLGVTIELGKDGVIRSGGYARNIEPRIKGIDEL